MMRVHNPNAVWQVPASFRGIYSHAVELPTATSLLFLSGQVGVRPDGSVAETFPEQCRQAMSNVETLLAEGALGSGDMVKVTYYVTDGGDIATLGDIRRERWSMAAPPAVTTLVVAALARPEWKVEIDVVAAKPVRPQ